MGCGSAFVAAKIVAAKIRRFEDSSKLRLFDLRTVNCTVVAIIFPQVSAQCIFLDSYSSPLRHFEQE
jgi:hypothetical protein